MLLTCGLLITCSPVQSFLGSVVLGFNSFSGHPMAFMFENLQIYQKAVDLADETAALTGALSYLA